MRMSVFRWPLQELPIAVVGTPVSKAKKSSPCIWYFERRLIQTVMHISEGSLSMPFIKCFMGGMAQ